MHIATSPAFKQNANQALANASLQKALEELARQRGQTIADALKTAGVDPARVSTSTGEATTSRTPTRQVTVQLTLATR